MVRLLAQGNGEMRESRRPVDASSHVPAAAGTPAGGAGFLPDLDFQFQIDSELLADLRAGQVDELQNVLRGGARMADDEVGVAVAEFGLADLCPFETGLVDQPAGAHPPGILEDADRKSTRLNSSHLGIS